MVSQATLLHAADLGAPEGFVYEPNFVSESEERALLDWVQREVSFKTFEMRGQVARRRVAHFGYDYAYDNRDVSPRDPLPAALLPLRDRVAAFLEVPPDQVVEALVTEYTPEAGIGWHRDAPVFGVVAGVSLLADCDFRFRRGESGRSVALPVARRSVYKLTGEARWGWQHHIPPMKELRYSITFRTLRKRP
ncbi:MAG TPA: alpha-ketoglutarate-dependent dioxygenase AlkB [Polyangia bacterium]